jgi:hypothetical protein
MLTQMRVWVAIIRSTNESYQLNATRSNISLTNSRLVIPPRGIPLFLCILDVPCYAACFQNWFCMQFSLRAVHISQILSKGSGNLLQYRGGEGLGDAK